MAVQGVQAGTRRIGAAIALVRECPRPAGRLASAAVSYRRGTASTTPVARALLDHRVASGSLRRTALRTAV